MKPETAALLAQRKRFSPEAFEAYVADYLRSVAHLEARDGGSLRIERGEIFRLSAGDFAIDVTVRFKAVGGDYLTLIECKHLSRRVERKVVQELNDKKQQIHAHKAMVFSTSGFQKGAIRYARELGIALYGCSPHDGPVCIVAGEGLDDLPGVDLSPPAIEPFSVNDPRTPCRQALTALAQAPA